MNDKSLISRLSIQDKIAQLTGIWLRDLLEDGKLSRELCRQKIPHGIGHISQFASGLPLAAKELKQVVDDLQAYLIEETDSGIPAIFHEEAITGFSAKGATTLPQQIGMGCSWNPEQLYANTQSTARNMRAVGSCHALSPMLDVSRNPHWGRIEESFGEDTYLAAVMGLAFVRGLQGEDWSQGVAATVKHFAGYGGDTDNPLKLREDILFPHEAAIRLGHAECLMPGYHEVNGVPCSASKTLMNDIPREEWGFDGLIVSDYGSVNQVYHKYGYASDPQEAGLKCIHAGLDVELPEANAFLHLEKALNEGKISIETIDKAVERVLKLKEKVGLLSLSPDKAGSGPIDLDPPEHRQLAYVSACESIVLLKNEGVLPLAETVKSIAVVGPNANAVQSLCGDYTYQSLSQYFWKLPVDPENPKLVTLLQGLKSRLGEKVKLQYERGCDWIDELSSGIDAVDTSVGDERIREQDAVRKLVVDESTDPARALEIASQSDVIIAAMGENLFICGECRDRSEIYLPGEQEKFVLELAKTGKPVILIVMGGRPMILTNLESSCAAILQAWYPGEEGGHALADIITGQVNPSAKLCVSLPANNPEGEQWVGQADQEAYQPLYPFGHGLSYSHFEYADFSCPEASNTGEDAIEVTCSLENTSATPGTEIVQLYLSAKELAIPRAMRLKGFTRVHLEAGERRSVRFELSPELFAFYNAEMKLSIEPGRYDIAIGASSKDLKFKGTLELTGETIELKTRSRFFTKVSV